MTTTDGRQLDLNTVGTGPGVVVVHGSAVSAKDYHRLAAALAACFTVHLYDRRGRGDRGPVDDTHGVASDVEDLRTVLTHTAARNVLAHSYGGLVALQAAMRLPVDRIAVFDAAVSIDGDFPSAYVDPFARAVAAGNFPLAMAVLSKGLQSVGAVSRLPIPVQWVLAHLFAVTPMGREWRTMVSSAVVEAREIVAYDCPATAYSGISAEVLLITGARSPGYFRRASELLSRGVEQAHHVVVPAAGHNAVNVAVAPLVRQLEVFFGSDAG